MVFNGRDLEQKSGDVENLLFVFFALVGDANWNLGYLDVLEELVPLSTGLHFLNVVDSQLGRGGHLHIKTCRLFVLLFLLLKYTQQNLMG